MRCRRITERRARERWAAAALGIALVCGPDYACAACNGRTFASTRPGVQGFLIRPLSLLERNPRGGSELSGDVANLLTSDSVTTLRPVISLIGLANKEQRRAVAAGIGSALTMCGANRPEEADRIRGTLLNVADPTTLSMVFDSMGPRGDTTTPTRSPDAQQPFTRRSQDPFAPFGLPGTGPIKP